MHTADSSLSDDARNSRTVNPPPSCVGGEWKTTTLGDMADIKNGATPNTRIAAYWNGTIPWCIPTDITNTSGKYLLTTDRRITTKGLLSCGSTLLPVGALLLCSRATIGEVKIAAIPVCTNQGFKSLICKDGVSNLYLYYLLGTLNPQIIKMATGSTFLEISKRAIASIVTRLPPSTEQCAIGEALSDVDELLDALEVLTAKTRAIKQATMEKLLTGQVRLPGFTTEWKTKRIGNICKFLTTANNPRADLNGYGDVEYVHYGDIHVYAQPVLDCTRCDLPRISQNRIANAATLIDGDLVMVDASEDLEGIGKSIEIQGTRGRSVVAGLHTILCRSAPGHWALGFKAYLQFIPKLRSALLRVATGISVYAIAKKHLADIELSLPPPLEQAAIVLFLADMDSEIIALEQHRDKIRAIKQGMIQRLLSGQIRLVDPDNVQKRATVTLPVDKKHTW